MKFHHIGIACKDINKTVENFLTHHTNILNVSDVVFDSEQNAYLQIIELDDNTRYEFISGDMVKSLLDKNIDLYHTCFEVDNISLEVKRLSKEKAFPISKPKPAILFGGREVVFIKTMYGIVELLESKK